MKGDPHYPLPWSADGSGAYLVTPSETRAFLEKAGFEEIVVEDTGAKYVAAYKVVIEKAEKGALPPLGIHILMGETALQKTRNAARNMRRRPYPSDSVDVPQTTITRNTFVPIHKAAVVLTILVLTGQNPQT